MLGEENMSGVATIHNALRHVDSCPEEIGLIVHIRDWIDRATVNAHAYFKFRATTGSDCFRARARAGNESGQTGLWARHLYRANSVCPLSRQVKTRFGNQPSRFTA